MSGMQALLPAIRNVCRRELLHSSMNLMPLLVSILISSSDIYIDPAQQETNDRETSLAALMLIDCVKIYRKPFSL